MEDIEEKLLRLMQGEHSHLSIEYNPHASSYITAAEAVERGDELYGDWVSDEERDKAIATNRVWMIQWYPHTPVGFCCLMASTLDEVLKAALEAKE